jgi:hypothetical protein
MLKLAFNALKAPEILMNGRSNLKYFVHLQPR